MDEMSRENVEATRAGFRTLERDGVEGLLTFIHPDFETTTPAELTVEPATYRGHDGIRRYFESFYEVMDEVRFEPEDFIDAGERVVVPVRLVARGRDTGIEAEQRLAFVWTLRDRKALRLETFPTLEAALEAVDPAS
jgi:ketosteroid isomerase-like protein